MHLVTRPGERTYPAGPGDYESAADENSGPVYLPQRWIPDPQKLRVTDDVEGLAYGLVVPGLDKDAPAGADPLARRSNADERGGRRLDTNRLERSTADSDRVRSLSAARLQQTNMPGGTGQVRDRSMSFSSPPSGRMTELSEIIRSAKPPASTGGKASTLGRAVRFNIRI